MCNKCSTFEKTSHTKVYVFCYIHAVETLDKAWHGSWLSNEVFVISIRFHAKQDVQIKRSIISQSHCFESTSQNLYHETDRQTSCMSANITILDQ